MLDRWREVLTEEAEKYDQKQSRTKSYNMWARDLYVEGINNALKDPAFLNNPRKALAKEFLIKGETGGIYHRNLPTDYSNVKFSLPFINAALRRMKE